MLWEYSLPAPQEALPAVYQVGGQEHIAVPVGGGAVFQPRRSPNIPLRPAGPGQYMVFALPKKSQILKSEIANWTG